MKTKEPKFPQAKSEVKDFSNLAGFFALLYQIDRRNKQISSTRYEDQKSRNRPSQAL
jgi:hypothetical protein